MDMNIELIHKELSTLQKKFALIDIEDIDLDSNYKTSLYLFKKCFNSASGSIL